ncbi:hypothetical protein FB451DRAFT_1565766 [Mycena latifolia]|nr:hypothetical protein FB451DRAFT_1565766 [Mycena latifolia]
MSKRRVAYYDSGGHRVRVAHDLVSAYGILPKMHVLRAKRATPESMTALHTDEYINFLARVTPETQEELTHGEMLCVYTRLSFSAATLTRREPVLVGLLPDNLAFEGVFEFCSISAGGSIAAARRVSSRATDIAIN